MVYRFLRCLAKYIYIIYIYIIYEWFNIRHYVGCYFTGCRLPKQCHVSLHLEASKINSDGFFRWYFIPQGSICTYFATNRMVTTALILLQDCVVYTAQSCNYITASAVRTPINAFCPTICEQSKRFFLHYYSRAKRWWNIAQKGMGSFLHISTCQILYIIGIWLILSTLITHLIALSNYVNHLIRSKLIIFRHLIITSWFWLFQSTKNIYNMNLILS